MNRKQSTMLLIDLLLAGLSGSSIVLINKYIENNILAVFLTMTVIVAFLALVFLEYRSLTQRKNRLREYKHPTSVVLLGEKERPVYVWNLAGHVGLLIGKSTDTVHPDIDLLETEYHTFVDEEHAVINFTSTGWWIEDIGSQTGTSLLRQGERILLPSRTPTPLELGDILFIGEKTRLAIE